MNQKTLLFLANLIFVATGFSQIKNSVVGIETRTRFDENTTVFEKSSGRKLSKHEVESLLMPENFGKYFLEPMFDESADPFAYTMRKKTEEEMQTNNTYNNFKDNQPKVKDLVASFKAKDINNNIYESQKLLGKTIILSFWL